MKGRLVAKPLGRSLIPLAVIAGSILVAVALAEAVLRLVGVAYPSFTEFDPDRGLSRLRPGAEGWYTKEGKAYIRINSDGLRDQEHSLPKPAGSLRIAILGDSYAQAFELDQDKAFWAVMQRGLGQCEALRGVHVEVINFGVSGYGTSQEWLTLQMGAWKYDPDIVLLAFLTGNDVRNNSYALEADPERPYHVLHQGRLELIGALAGSRHSKTWRELRGWLLDHSRLFQLVNYLRSLYLQKAQGDVATGNAAVAVGMDRLEEKVYLAPADAVWQEAWEVTEAVIREMNRDIEAHGKTFFVATLSNGIQVNPDHAKREAYIRRFGISDLLYPDRRIIALAKQEGIPSFMLAPALLEWSEDNKTCVHGFDNAVPCGGHWNEHGHRVVGEILSQEICSQILGKKASYVSEPPPRG